MKKLVICVCFVIALNLIYAQKKSNLFDGIWEDDSGRTLLMIEDVGNKEYLMLYVNLDDPNNYVKFVAIYNEDEDKMIFNTADMEYTIYSGDSVYQKYKMYFGSLKKNERILEFELSMNYFPVIDIKWFHKIIPSSQDSKEGKDNIFNGVWRDHIQRQFLMIEHWDDDNYLVVYINLKDPDNYLKFIGKYDTVKNNITYKFNGTEFSINGGNLINKDYEKSHEILLEGDNAILFKSVAKSAETKQNIWFTKITP